MKIISQCGCEFDIPHSLDYARGATLDCPKCGSLLIIPSESEEKDGAVKVRLFHDWMREQSPTWPKDGAGTGFVEV